MQASTGRKQRTSSAWLTGAHTTQINVLKMKTIIVWIAAAPRGQKEDEGHAVPGTVQVQVTSPNHSTSETTGRRERTSLPTAHRVKHKRIKKDPQGPGETCGKARRWFPVQGLTSTGPFPCCRGDQTFCLAPHWDHHVTHKH